MGIKKKFKREEVLELIRFMKRYTGMTEHTTPEFVLKQFESQNQS